MSQLFSQSCPLGYFTVESFAQKDFHFSLSLQPGPLCLFLDIVRRQELNTWSVTSLLRSAGGTHS